MRLTPHAADWLKAQGGADWIIAQASQQPQPTPQPVATVKLDAPLSGAPLPVAAKREMTDEELLQAMINSRGIEYVRKHHPRLLNHEEK
jgi:hypothetical protein